MRNLSVSLFFVFAIVSNAAAQIMTQSTRFAAPGESEIKKAEAAPRSESGINLLPQATIAAGTNSPEIGLQIGDLYMTSRWRVYIRTNLPLKANNTADQSPAGAQPLAGGQNTMASVTTKPSDHVIAALLDEYGGLLNSTVGTYRCLVKWSGDDGACKDPKMPDHGLFFDGRIGMKFIDLPTVAGTNAPTISDVSVTPFYTGIVTLRFIAPLFDDTEVKHLVGGLTMNASYVISRVADSTLSDLFKSGAVDQLPAMRLVNQDLVVSVGINLGGVTYLSLSGTPWVSDARLGKRFVVGLNLARPTKDTKSGKTPGML